VTVRPSTLPKAREGGFGCGNRDTRIGKRGSWQRKRRIRLTDRGFGVIKCVAGFFDRFAMACE
jgi:hypothetical protein